VCEHIENSLKQILRQQRIDVKLYEFTVSKLEKKKAFKVIHTPAASALHTVKTSPIYSK